MTRVISPAPPPPVPTIIVAAGEEDQQGGNEINANRSHRVSWKPGQERRLRSPDRHEAPCGEGKYRIIVYFSLKLNLWREKREIEENGVISIDLLGLFPYIVLPMRCSDSPQCIPDVNGAATKACRHLKFVPSLADC
jgi:hypothetical protein